MGHYWYRFPTLIKHENHAAYKKPTIESGITIRYMKLYFPFRNLFSRMYNLLVLFTVIFAA